MSDELNKMRFEIRRSVPEFSWRNSGTRIQKQFSRSADRDLKPGPPEYKTDVLWKKCSVVFRHVDWYIFTDVSKRRFTEHLQGQAVTRRDGPEDLSDNRHRNQKAHCCQPRLLMVMFHTTVFGDPEFNTFSVSLHSGTNLFRGAAAQREPWPPNSFTHNDVPQSE